MIPGAEGVTDLRGFMTVGSDQLILDMLCHLCITSDHTV